MFSSKNCWVNRTKKNKTKKKKHHLFTCSEGGNNMPVSVLTGGALAGFEVSGQPCFYSTLCLPPRVPTGSSQFWVCEKCIVRASRQWSFARYLQKDDVNCCDTPFVHKERERLITVPRQCGQSWGHECPSCSSALSSMSRTCPSLYFHETKSKSRGQF